MTVELDQNISDNLPFEPKQQDAIFGYCLIDKNFFVQVKDRLKASWFLDPWTAKAYEGYVKFWGKYGHEPKSDDELFLFDEFYALPPLERAKTKAAIVRGRQETTNYSLDVLRTGLTGWMQSRVFHQYVNQSATLFNSRKFSEAKSVLATAVKELQEISFEGKAPADFSNPRELIQSILALADNALTLGHPLLDRMLNPDCKTGSLLPGDSTVFLSPTNIGKCLGRGTPVMKSDGTIVPVEGVRLGDSLMGPDGTPRKVLSLTRGTGPLFRIEPKSGGDSWVCNDVHVLTLRGPDGLVDIPLDQYLAKSNDWKKKHPLVRTSIDFLETGTEPSVDPYVLGLWLGDGTEAHAHLTTADPENENSWISWVEAQGDSWYRTDDKITIRACRNDDKDKLGSNSFNALKAIGVIDDKHIPHSYKTGSRTTRFKVLAGLVDSDGYLGPNGCLEIVQKRKNLADDTAFVARSLGFKVSVNETQKTAQTGVSGQYWNVSIRGPLSTIPTKLKRKQGLDGVKNPLTTGFRVVPLGLGDYFGFTLDKDHRFLLGDFTITHNTTTKITVAVANLMAGKKVIFITHEGRKADIMEKIWCSMLRCTKGEFRQLGLSDNPQIVAQISSIAKLIAENLVYIDYQKPGSTVEEVVSMVRQHQQRLVARTGKGYDLFLNDYPAILGAEGLSNLRMERRHKDAYVYRYLVDYAGEQEMHGIYSIQTNRDGSRKNKRSGEYHNKQHLVVLEDVQEAYEVTNSATNLITINRSPEDQARDRTVFLICKSRSSATNVAVACRSDFRRSRSHDAQLPATWWQGTESLDHLDSLLVEYANQEVPYNYKDLLNATTKS